jgi:hypothetical protein
MEGGENDCFPLPSKQPNMEHSKGHRAWNLPLATKQGASPLTSNDWIRFKGHQAWNLPLATKLGFSFISLLPFLFKGANLDHLSLYFLT